MKKILFTAIIAVFLSACSEGGVFQKEKNYTPLYVLHNPLPLYYPEVYYNEENFTQSYYPDFVNYPDDRTKLGLRKDVSKVEYAQPIGGAEYTFDEQGKLQWASHFFDKGRMLIEVYAFRYDDKNRLMGVYRNPQKNPHVSSDQTFEYDEQGRLVKRKGGMMWANQVYSYYNDGTLKEITPQYFNKGNDKKGKMMFDTSGRLISMEAYGSSNPFMEAHNCTGSICTYTYEKDNGLCTEKQEKFIYKEDTIVCTNRYTYNEMGDLASWEYTGGVYQINLKRHSQYIFFNTTLRVTFAYEYDSHGNWTTMRVTVPENFMEYEYLIRAYDAFLRFRGLKYYDGYENRIWTINRHISYFSTSSSKSLDEVKTIKEKTQQAKETVKINAPRFTAVQGYGLYGKVKSVTSTNGIIVFDENGNIVRRGTDEYSYQGPEKYMINKAVGPFRITCEGNLRKEVDENGIEGATEYEFDEHGRVVCHRYFNGMMPVIRKYTYEGTDKHPSTIEDLSSYEEGEESTKYRCKYLETDKYGNWTKREITCSRNNNLERTTETRTLVYY